MGRCHVRFQLGTHNTLDGAARPSMFADLILFTEAAVTLADRARFARRGFALVVCRQQRDLAIAYRRSLFKRAGDIHYAHLVDGWKEVTPPRGTAWLPLVHRPSRDLLAAVWAHRINAAFPPYVRGEPVFRRAAWHRHTDHDVDLIDRLSTSGYVVPAGGDVNTPPDVRGYPGSLERGTGFDRLALSPPNKHHRTSADAGETFSVLREQTRWTLGPAEYLSNAGSDHPRLRATVTRTTTR